MWPSDAHVRCFLDAEWRVCTKRWRCIVGSRWLIAGSQLVECGVAWTMLIFSKLLRHCSRMGNGTDVKIKWNHCGLKHKIIISQAEIANDDLYEVTNFIWYWILVALRIEYLQIKNSYIFIYLSFSCSSEIANFYSVFLCRNKLSNFE